MNATLVRIVRAATAAGAVLASLAAQGADFANSFTSCKPGASIFYINGIMNPNEQEVAASAWRLGANLTWSKVTCVTEVGHFYNPSDGGWRGWVADMWESAQQKATERLAASVRFEQLLRLALGLDATEVSQDDRALARVRTSALAATFSKNAVYKLNGVTVSTATFVDEWRGIVAAKLGTGVPVVLVGHSQGNFFANEVFGEVARTAPTLSHRLSVVNVANPASSAPSNLYVTGSLDWVIGAIPTAKGSNFDTTGALFRDWFAHNFSDVYLARDLPSNASDADSVGSRIATLVQQAINLTLTQTPAPTPTPTPTPEQTLVAPTLVAPINNVALSSLTPTLQWSGGSAPYWQVNIRNLTTTVLTPSAPLPPGQTAYVVPAGVLVAGTAYRWDVTACPDAACNNPATYRVSLDGYFTTAAGSVATSPDLQIEGATVNTPTVLPGGTVYVGFNIYNRGNATAAASTASIRINQSATSEVGTEVARAGVASLQSQQGFNFSATPFVAPTVPGTYQVWIVADADKVSGQNAAATLNDPVRAVGALTVAPASTTPSVSTATCSSAVVGQSLYCTITGINLPASASMSATNCSPTLMSIMAGGTATQRQFTCVPQAAGAVTVTYTVPGATGPVPTIASLTATSPTATPTVASVSCTNALVGQTMTCAVFGTHLVTPGIAVTVDACSGVVSGAAPSDTVRNFSCEPTSAGSTTLTVSSGGLAIATQAISIAPTALTTTFADVFGGASFDAGKWATAGSPTVVGGIADFPASTSASTAGKFAVNSTTIVVESRFTGPTAIGPTSGRDTWVALVDVATGDLIRFGDTSYGGLGMYYAAAGAFNLAQTGNGSTTSSYKEYRLTVSGTSLTVERGDSLSNSTETLTATLGASVAGKTFYLLIGTGAGNYSPGDFDWIVVKANSALARPNSWVEFSKLSGCINGTSQPGVQVSWDPLVGASNYVVLKLQGSGYQEVFSSERAPSAWVDTTLTPANSGQGIYYSMKARNAAGDGPEASSVITYISACP